MKKKGFPVVSFKQASFDLGEVKYGETRKVVFEFVNTGDVDLVIDVVVGSCGCTVPETYPKEPIPPGGKGVIHAVFNPEGKKPGSFRTTVDIISNTNPIVVEGEIKVIIVKPPGWKNKY